MRRVQKHNFEAVSLLTVDNGQLEVTAVPVAGQPDWLIPSSLILSVDPFDERIWTYLWQDQEVAVFQLIPKEEPPDKIVVLEGNTDVHRIGLQTKGDLKTFLVTISEVQDVPVPDKYLVKTPVLETNEASEKELTLVDEHLTQVDADANNDANSIEGISRQAPVLYRRELKENILSYVFQTVKVEDEIYVIPDLDQLAHHLVDLDS